MASPETDVLVIGAGPVGLTLACELQRHGVRVRLIDRKAVPNEHPNAAVVHVRSLEILSAMGAVAGFLQEGYALPGLHIHAFGKKIGFIDVGGIDSPYPLPRTLGQQHTERLLTEHLVRLGGKIERSVEAVGLEQDADEVRVRLKHPGENNREEIATARWVVGCEGSASLTRKTYGIPFPGERYAGKEFLQLDANVRWSYPHGYGYQFMTEERLVVMLPYDAEGHYRIICAQNDANPENDTPPTLEEMQAILRSLIDPAAEIYAPVWFNRFRSGHRLAERFREGRCFLAGDAGHVHVPIGGQGMNYGMHDAFNLAWKLAAVAKGEARPALLDTYETERHAADKALIDGTDFGFHLMLSSHPVRPLAVKFVAPLAFSLPAFQEMIRNTLGEIKVAYPTSALSEDHGASHGPAAGHRALDATAVRLPDRRTVQLFEVMRTTCWTLLLFAGHAPTTAEIETLERISAPLAKAYGTRLAIHLVLVDDPPVPIHANWAVDVLMDRERYAHDKYGAEAPCLYLIRPDWYIGFRGGLEQARLLTAYLEKILV
jgi:2-polyprenyl-6-methoxyphenol hydroxylase-like FAD-dependent oxidoreductase